MSEVGRLQVGDIFCYNPEDPGYNDPVQYFKIISTDEFIYNIPCYKTIRCSSKGKEFKSTDIRALSIKYMLLDTEYTCISGPSLHLFEKANELKKTLRSLDKSIKELNAERQSLIYDLKELEHSA